MLTQWKINRYRQNLAEEMRRRNNGGLLDSAFDRHWVEHMIGIAIRIAIIKAGRSKTKGARPQLS
jgi:hypothetical protein